MAQPFCTVTPMSSRQPAPALEIRLLGPPEVLVGGQPLQVDTRKAVAILALLAADGRPYARDELAAVLWPDSDGSAANGALRRTLSVMRAAIPGEALRIDRARVALDGSGVRVDLAELERLAGRGSRRDLAAAAALARGPFLAGFNLRDSPEFDDWRAARAVAVERLVLGVLDRLDGRRRGRRRSASRHRCRRPAAGPRPARRGRPRSAHRAVRRCRRPGRGGPPIPRLCRGPGTRARGRAAGHDHGPL